MPARTGFVATHCMVRVRVQTVHAGMRTGVVAAQRMGWFKFKDKG